MSLSATSKIGEILADPRGAAILEKHIPGAAGNRRIALMKGMPLELFQASPGNGVTAEALATIDRELKALG